MLQFLIYSKATSIITNLTENENFLSKAYTQNLGK